VAWAVWSRGVGTGRWHGGNTEQVCGASGGAWLCSGAGVGRRRVVARAWAWVMASSSGGGMVVMSAWVRALVEIRSDHGTVIWWPSTD